jgi:predicted 2-oxoglutarate/Fe(II)-dependent dioxygenase YbiX
MLSNITDYDGGEFYVAKRCNDTNGKKKKQRPSVIRMCSPKLNAGDLILFQASKEGDYDHGMKTVTRGERVAIGLLQPVPKKD